MSVHGSPVISFPAHELADLKARLAAGHTISSAHPQGKHKAGDILMSSLGMLRVLGVKPVAPHELTAHSGAVKARVAGSQGDMLELKKLGEAAVTKTAMLASEAEAMLQAHSPGAQITSRQLAPEELEARDSRKAWFDQAMAAHAAQNGGMIPYHAVEALRREADQRFPLSTPGKVAMTDTPALDILAEQAKTAGLADLGRNALMAGAIGSAGVAGGMGGHALGHNIGTRLDPSNPSPAWHAPASQQMAAEMHPANTLGGLGALGGAGGGAGAAALALLAARRRGVPLGAGPVA